LGRPERNSRKMEPAEEEEEGSCRQMQVEQRLE
jgi:hypothetical protein